MSPFITASLTIRTYGDPILQKKTKLVTDLAAVKDLIPAMFQLMYAEPGIGLAANQVGVSLRLTVIDIPDEGRSRPMVLVNPKMEEKKGRVKASEGCLSLPGISADVVRSASVRVSALNEHGFRDPGGRAPGAMPPARAGSFGWNPLRGPAVPPGADEGPPRDPETEKSWDVVSFC
jgi:peptide deformylase